MYSRGTYDDPGGLPTASADLSIRCSSCPAWRRSCISSSGSAPVHPLRDELRIGHRRRHRLHARAGAGQPGRRMDLGAAERAASRVFGARGTGDRLFGFVSLPFFRWLASWTSTATGFGVGLAATAPWCSRRCSWARRSRSSSRTACGNRGTWGARWESSTS
jgi:hypothetical protein